MGAFASYLCGESGDINEARERQPLIRRVISTVQVVRDGCFQEFSKLWHGRLLDFPEIAVNEEEESKNRMIEMTSVCSSP